MLSITQMEFQAARDLGIDTLVFTLGYHAALAVALALASLAVEAHPEHAFLTQFLAQWGGAHANTRRGTERRRARA